MFKLATIICNAGILSSNETLKYSKLISSPQMLHVILNKCVPMLSTVNSFLINIFAKYDYIHTVVPYVQSFAPIQKIAGSYSKVVFRSDHTLFKLMHNSFNHLFTHPV